MNKTLFNSTIADKIFKVGGCVRDSLLQCEVNDIDYVACVDENTFIKEFPNAECVGKSFPVYLIEGDEVAISRTEKSNGHGYGSFEITNTGVTIEEDLRRRDLTINAMAVNIKTNELVDPFGGREDLKNKIIKTTYNDSFYEDPVRILRAVRFACKYNFEIEHQTLQQIEKFKGELKYVTKERIVLEFEKVWNQGIKLSEYIKLLDKTGVIRTIFPEIKHINYQKIENTQNTRFKIFLAVLFDSVEDIQQTINNNSFKKEWNNFLIKTKKVKETLRQLDFITPLELSELSLSLGKELNDIRQFMEVNYFNPTRLKTIENFKNIDFSVLAKVEPKLKANEAHKLRVRSILAFEENNERSKF